MFTKNSGVELLTIFLMKNNSQDDLWLQQNLDTQIEEIFKNRQQNKVKKQALKKKTVAPANKVKRYEEMQRCLKGSELGSGFEGD